MKKPTRCDACQMVKPLEKAHIRSRGAGGSNKETNIMFLCREDHAMQHRMGHRLFLLKYPKLVELLKHMGWELNFINGRFIMSHKDET